MTALFADEARRRRDRLALALRDVSAPKAVTFEAEPVASVPPQPLPRSRRWLVAAIVASLGAGLAAIAWVSGHAAPAAVPVKVDPPEAKAEALPVPATAPPPSVDAVPAPAPMRENAIPASATKPAPKQAIPAKPAPVSRQAPLRKLPDVDPSPF
jgi:hypothetical protein